MNSKKWVGERPKNCDFCQKPLQKFFIDGKTSLGPWGILCLSCHSIHGIGLGTGKGQKYNLETLEREP